jgi:hypothetical protein
MAGVAYEWLVEVEPARASTCTGPPRGAPSGPLEGEEGKGGAAGRAVATVEVDAKVNADFGCPTPC